MSTDVLTRSFGSARTGANTAEVVLTPTAVRTRGVRTLLTLQTDDPRIEAQPLYVSALTIGAKTRNVIYQATMGNTVFAWDADTGELVWKTHLGKPINGTNAIDAHNINVKWGILSTPVIDRAAGVLYACAWISPDSSGNWQTGQHFFVALDIKTGQLTHPLLSLEGATYDPGNGQPVQQFRSAERKQRAALAMVGGAVLVTFGTIAETAQTARGWIIAIDPSIPTIAATWCSTVHGGGGIWMSGAGPAIQSNGSIWVVTGNGAFDGAVDFSESVVRLHYTPAAPPHPASLTVTGSWTPWTDFDRTRHGTPHGEAIARNMIAGMGELPKASNFRLLPHLVRMGFDPLVGGNDPWNDQDLGSSGIVLVESLGIGLVSGKDGILYTINLAHPGNTVPADLTNLTAVANYAKLAAPPILYTFFDPAVPPAPSDPTKLNQLSARVTHHLHGTPVAWLSAAHGQVHFCGGENGNLRAWAVDNKGVSSYLGCSSAYASANVQAPPGGMPGWNIALSANGQNDGIIWAMIPYGDANMNLTNGRLLAYDAAQFAHYADGSGEIVTLWDSQDWGWNFLHPKFNRPVATGGKILLPTYDGRLLVLGLA